MGAVVRVRPVRTDDAEAVATAHVLAWRAGYQGILPEPYLEAIDLPARIARWRNWLRDDDFRLQRVHVAELDGAVVGFAIHGPQRDGVEPADPPGTTGELYALNVHPDHWGAGAGGALLDHVSASLAAAGHSEAVLWVLRGNARARGFYEHHGWAPDGAEKTETQDGAVLDEVRYRRALPAV